MPSVTYHIVAQPYYEGTDPEQPYIPEAYAADGFIHCTDGIENLIATANRYYRDDVRPFVALVINVDAVTAPVRYEDDAGIYPHIYGALNRESIASALRMRRDADGTFVAISLPKPG